MVIWSLAVRQHVVVYGITMTVEGDYIGYGSPTGLCVVEGNEAKLPDKAPIGPF